MATYGRALESRELRAVQPDRWTSRDSYQHGADGGRGDTQSTHHHCERCILAERHGPSPDHGYFREGARPLRPRSPSSPLSQRERGRGGEGVRLSSMEAIRKMTLLPAQRLEARVPAMHQKGRLRVGADADITLFDPATVLDRSTYREPSLPPVGIQHVIVNGVSVVAN